MSTSNFVHLHVHTEYSLLDGLSNIKKLIAYVAKLGMNSLAITDHGVMYGAIEFYKESLKQGIKPIIGMEGYVTASQEKKIKDNFHITLLAKDYEGYKNLMKLTSIAHLKGFYYKPRFTIEILNELRRGLICLSGCPAAQIPSLLIEGNYPEAKKLAESYLDIFGDDFFLEIQRHNYKSVIDKVEGAELKEQIRKMAVEEEAYEKGIIKLSRDLGIPIVATNDAHYITKDDAQAQDALVCIATGKNISDIKRLRYIDNPDYYIKTPEEMEELFIDLPEAVKNTVEVAGRCSIEIPLGKWSFPSFPIPEGINADEYLKKIAFSKLKEKIPDAKEEEIKRLDYELGIISQKGYSTYFLIMMELANWANEKGIITNTRGSAAGSLVSYVLGITTVNPIKYYLPFERFLNPYRPSPPDIDFDVADDRREEILRHIADTYGHDRVAQICTFGRMLSRAAVRDVARVLGYPYSVGDRIAKLIPPPKQGFPVTIPKALKEVETLRNLYDSDKDVKKIIDLAIQLEGCARHLSVHAAGVVVAPSEITNFVPVQLEPSGDKIITQYEMHAAEDVGLIKFDILGIRNLSILGAAIKIVEDTCGKKVNIREIPLDDKKTFEMLARGDTMGVFQLGSAGMTKFLKELKPSRIEDIMAMVALYRPGPISQIPEYIKRKHNPKLVKYLDPRMEKFLGASYGLIVYQDDLLFCAIELAGYTWEEADKFRKAVGKKIPEEMAAQKERFTKGIIEHGQTAEFAEELWKLFEPFQSYGFNKAHAASYGLVAYQTAYMKANYPVEYMCALMSAESSDTDKVAEAVNECRRLGIEVLPPDINRSAVGFSIEDYPASKYKKAIRFGLNAIKNVGQAAIDSIISAREKGEFTSFTDFIGRVDSRRVNKKVLESLIKVGALSRFGKRAALLKKVEEYKKSPTNKIKDENQSELFSSEDIGETNDFDIIEDIDELSDKEIEVLERELLGFSISAKPISEILKNFEDISDYKISDVLDVNFTSEIGNSVSIVGVLNDLRVIVTKKSGQEMAFAKIKDDTGVINVVIFPSVYAKVRNWLVEDAPYLISGTVDRKEEDVSLIVDSIKDEEAIIAEKDVAVISIPEHTDKVAMEKLKNVLVSNPGDHKVCLVFEGKRKTRLNLDIRINWSQPLRQEIRKILGPGGYKD